MQNTNTLTAAEAEKVLMADEKILMDLLRINYREKFSENQNLKNYNIAHCLDFYYMDDFLIADAKREMEEQNQQNQQNQQNRPR